MSISRNFSKIDKVFVAVAEWNIPGTEEWIKQYFGPYDTPGKAKALRTRNARKPGKGYELVRTPVIRAVQWEEI